MLATTTSELDEDSRSELAAAIRRTLLALALDPHVTEQDVQVQVTAVIRGFIATEAPILT